LQVIIIFFDNLIPKGVYFNGDDVFSRFGWRSSWGDINGDKVIDLIISEPFLNHEKGRVHIWHGGSKFPRPPSGINFSESADMCFEYTYNHEQARYGNDLFFLKEKNNQIMIITAPRDSQFGFEMSGSVTIQFADQ